MIGKAGPSAVATLVERHGRFMILLCLPEGKMAGTLADVLIATVNDLPALIHGSLTWNQGTEMAHHSQLSVATDLPEYFAHPHQREHQPTGAGVPAQRHRHHQPYLDAIADKLNDRPRAVLGILTPRDVFTKLLNDNVGLTG